MKVKKQELETEIVKFLDGPGMRAMLKTLHGQMDRTLMGVREYEVMEVLDQLVDAGDVGINKGGMTPLGKELYYLTDKKRAELHPPEPSEEE